MVRSHKVMPWLVENLADPGSGFTLISFSVQKQNFIILIEVNSH